MYSMGGSVAVHVAAKKILSTLAGLVVVDVVEVWFLKTNILIIFCLCAKTWYVKSYWLSF